MINAFFRRSTSRSRRLPYIEDERSFLSPFLLPQYSLAKSLSFLCHPASDVRSSVIFIADGPFSSGVRMAAIFPKQSDSPGKIKHNL